MQNVRLSDANSAVLLSDKKQIHKTGAHRRGTVGGRYEDAWELEDSSVNRQRVTSVGKHQTEQFTLRASSVHMRVLDEIIHSGIDPRLKTKSDCVQDAIALFIEDWIHNYADGLGGRTLRMLHFEQSKRERDSREDFLVAADEEIAEEKKKGNRTALEHIKMNLENERDDSSGAPDSYLKEIQGRIEGLEKTLQKEIIW